MAIRIADEHDIDYEVMEAILDAEHHGKDWRTGEQNDVVSPTDDRGLCQISKTYWKDITDEQAFDAEWCLNWMAGQIADGNESIYTSCSCVSFIRARGYSIPRIKNPSELVPNTIPSVGSIALFEYKDGVHHMAEVIHLDSDTFRVSESNFERCKRTVRDIRYDDPSLRGFYVPENL